MPAKPCYPFPAIVGQDLLKTALLIACIEPKTGGVLISGPRGSAKSTIVRSLQPLVPKRHLTTLPLGATEEMVAGSINLQTAIAENQVAFSPGLLAKSHQGMLYVDEVNLLPDHLVDLLLDVAASGVNVIERDGISYDHPAEFVLMGTMNPDEGELRPQLLDRFGLMVPVAQDFSIEQRQQIVKRRIRFDHEPTTLINEFTKEINRLTDDIQWAVSHLAEVTVSDNLLTRIATLCSEAGVEGMRADITMYRACRAHAALQKRLEVQDVDIDSVCELVLAHRRKQNPPPSAPPPSGTNNAPSTGNESNNDNHGSSIQGSWGAMPVEPVVVDNGSVDIGVLSALRPHPITKADTHQQAIRISTAVQPKSATKLAADSRRFRSANVAKHNHPNVKVDWFKTLTDTDNLFAYQHLGKRKTIRFRRPTPSKINLDIVLLDTSSSTLRGNGLNLALNAIRHLSHQSYLHRHRLALVTFGNDKVNMVLTPQRAPKNIDKVFTSIKAGGGTPLRQGLQFVNNMLGKYSHRQCESNLYLLTDGRTHESAGCLPPSQCDHSILVDIESSSIKLGLGAMLAAELNASYVHIQSFTRGGDSPPQ